MENICGYRIKKVFLDIYHKARLYIYVMRVMSNDTTLSWKLPGFTSTIMRESFAYTTWFGSYFDLTQKYKWSPFYAGGVSGMLAWTVSFPFRETTSTTFNILNSIV